MNKQAPKSTPQCLGRTITEPVSPKGDGGAQGSAFGQRFHKHQINHPQHRTMFETLFIKRVTAFLPQSLPHQTRAGGKGCHIVPLGYLKWWR